MTSDEAVFGAIDAGGTTFKCALLTKSGAILERQRVPVTGPDDTLSHVIAFFTEALQTHDTSLHALGIACFGPVDIDPLSERYGAILKTPKPGWSGTPVREHLSNALGAPVHCDTDVNGALLAESQWGAGRGCGSAAYVTVGTGIGAAISHRGALLGRPLHPEFGHIRVQRHPDDRDFAGVCPFHGDCLEGVASATALTARYGDPTLLPAGHLGWRIEAHYLAQACLALSLTARVERIVLGGGLMLAEHLLAMIHHSYTELMNGYLGSEDVESLITTPELGDDAGLFGGFRVALLGANVGAPNSLPENGQPEH